MLLLLACLLVFMAIALLVVGLSMKPESVLNARMAALRGERPIASYATSVQSESLSVRVLGPLANSLGEKLSSLLPTKWVQALEKQLIAAGQPMTLRAYLALTVASFVLMCLFGLTMLSSGNFSGGLVPLMGAGIAGAGLYLPKFWLSTRVKGRQKMITKSLPDAFDLITTCVEAGLGLDAALGRVAEKVEGPFSDEMAITMKEISLGKLRRDALKEMADRCQIPDLSTFITAVVQAESMGTSIATVLRVQAEQMRIRRRQRAEQQAQQAPVKMIFPLVLCIFPTLFIVILGPAAITVYETLIKDGGA
jgi:tight adherence protein C